MKDIIKMANERPGDIYDLYVDDMKTKQCQVSTSDAYFLMNIILDPDIQPAIFKQMFKRVMTKNQGYATVEETFESINNGEVFMFLSKHGPILLNWINLANGVNYFMSIQYKEKNYKVYEENGFVQIDIGQLDENDIVDILMFSLFGEQYKNHKQEVIAALLTR